MPAVGKRQIEGSEPLPMGGVCDSSQSPSEPLRSREIASFITDCFMRWLLIEATLKGLFLGLCALALARTSSYAETGRVALCVAAALAVVLGIAGMRKFREGYRGRWPAFLLLILLESPGLVYGGVLVGMAAGVAFLGSDS